MKASQDDENDKEEEQKGEEGKKKCTCCVQGMGNGAEGCQQALVGTLPPQIPGKFLRISEL